MEYQFYELPNGIRLVHKLITSKVAHCGVIINTGTRDEKPEEHGMAHFIEHVIFKGTKRRKAYHIISRLDDVGGDLNAYTTKEETCIYAAFMHNYYDRALELFNDLLFNSTFPEKELEKEKEIIVDEINSYKDSPAELIYDDFEEIVFPNHPIGRNILGSKKNLKKFNKDNVQNFIRNNYHTNQMVVCSVGNIKFEKIVDLFKNHFGLIKPNIRTNGRQKFTGYVPVEQRFKKSTYQTHCIIGNIAYKIKNKNRITLFLLNNILGGPGLNSRLNLSLREKYGYAYNIESFYTPYTDTGLIGIYFGTDKDNLQKSLRIVKKELDKLKTQKLGKLQLHKAKRQLIGQLAIAAESYSNLMLNIGKSHMIFGQVDTLDETNRKIELISSEKIMEVANEIFDQKQLSILTYY